MGRRVDFAREYGGMLLAAYCLTMSHLRSSICDRCREWFAGCSYRVTSENDGERLLDMIVCYGCYLEASQLGLDTEEVESGRIALH